MSRHKNSICHKPTKKYKADGFQTPPEALDPLIPYLPRDGIIWEPACGKGNIVKKLGAEGFAAYGTDINNMDKTDFFGNYAISSEISCIVTNPPYSLKNEFIAKCYQIGLPFALLLPLTALESKIRQNLFREHGLELFLLPKRIAFETPSGKKSSPWFATAWFTHKLNLPKQLMFAL